MFMLLCLPSLAISAMRLPELEGTVPVSRRAFIWTDPSRFEDSTIPDKDPRHLSVFVFYPAVAAGKPAEYLPGFSTTEEGTATVGLKAQFLNSWDDVKNDKIQTRFSENAALAPSKMPYPVLIFSPGLGVPVLAYTIQLSELASHGYVIFALDHPYDTAAVKLSSGKLIGFADRHSPKGPPSAAAFRIDAEREAVWVADTQFALLEIAKLNSSDKSFRNLLDVSKVGLFGHSMGGRARVRACQVVTGARACVIKTADCLALTSAPAKRSRLWRHTLRRTVLC